ncbi:ImmA/IrrE family metallo-endopeptidase [Acidovorax sp. LjRoot117]|uniref:ImmA/IrrE family metallo-endopeptidase n=1 Tax=Acidovorax sp. LjRoot117 TaxID=3342255 RepID=UPI003ECCDB9B
MYQSSSLSPASAARMMLAGHWDQRLPVDPEALAGRVGLRVNPLPATAPYSGWFDDARRTIEYKQSEARVRRRFTIAHELGHFALGHGPRPRDTPAVFSSRVSDPKEREANQFAAELLMPEGAVKQVVQSGRFNTLDELATLFDVSKVAMSYRMNNLGFGFFS